MTPTHYNLVLSLNYYRFEFLKYQVLNFKRNLSEFSCLVVLNVSSDDYQRALETKAHMKDLIDVLVNPVCMERKRYHGSLTKCVVENMKYVGELDIEYDYFVVLSNRSELRKKYEVIDFDNIIIQVRDKIDLNQYKVAGIPFPYAFRNHLNRIERPRHHRKNGNHDDLKLWHWPLFSKTKLFQFFTERNSPCHGFPHEGLFFKSDVISRIVEFSESHVDIMMDLYEFEWCVEELFFGSVCGYLKQEFGFLDVYKFKFRKNRIIK